ncbi:MAG: flagellar type III secretion system pore protein FliP [Deltaproteobacteria bacterium]|nr:flagellar type III secretion system pore protein FliP [Deltaproteobacteria bacterium]
MGNNFRPFHLPLIIGIAGIIFLFFFASPGFAQTKALSLPSIKIGVTDSKNPEETSVLLQILFLLTILSLAPAILIMMTSFTRLIIVFSFLRNAMGIPQMPPNQILIGLSLFLTFFIMTPVWQAVKENAYTPYMEKKFSQEKALEEAIKPIRQFMFKQTREKDLALFMGLSKIPKPKNTDDIPTTVLLPAFMISELKTAFQMGFVLFLPFLVIDVVVSSILLSMGMMMLPPVMISMPFKILLFVLVDGWHLIVGSMVKGFY